MKVLWQKAVVDRIVDCQHAVLLVGDDEAEHLVPVSGLPEGAIEGTWLKVRFLDRSLVEVTIDRTATEQARQRIRSNLEELRKRGRREM